MTRIEQLNAERVELTATVEGIRKELFDIRKDEGKEARVKELDEQLNRAWADSKALDQHIADEEKLAKMKRDDEARLEARAVQAAPRPGDSVVRAQLRPTDEDLTPHEIAERSALNMRFMKGETLTDAEAVKRAKLTNKEKAFWRDARVPKGRYANADPAGLADSLRQLGLITSDQAEEMKQRALSTTASTVAADGGNLIPEGFVAELIRESLFYGPMNDTNLIRQVITPDGRPLSWPNVNDTARKATLIAEGADVTDKKVTFGELSLNAYKYTSGFFPVTSEILQDSAFDLEGELRSFMAESYGRGLNEVFTTADGSSKPQGLVSKVGGVEARVAHMGTAKTIKVADIFDTIGKLDPSYRQNARFMFHSDTELELHKLADTTGRPLLQPDVTSGMVNRILGYPYLLNNDMEKSTATDKDVVLFGDLREFVVRRVRPFSINRLDEIAARSDQVVFVAFGRVDSEVLQTVAFSVLNSATT